MNSNVDTSNRVNWLSFGMSRYLFLRFSGILFFECPYDS